MSSAELDPQQQQQMMIDTGVNRRSFGLFYAVKSNFMIVTATSTASSSDISSPLGQHGAFGGATTTPLTASQLADPSSIPSVDGIAAGSFLEKL